MIILAYFRFNFFNGLYQVFFNDFIYSLQHGIAVKHILFVIGYFLLVYKEAAGIPTELASFSSRSAETKVKPLSSELKCLTDISTFSDSCSWDIFFAFR